MNLYLALVLILAAYVVGFAAGFHDRPKGKPEPPKRGKYRRITRPQKFTPSKPQLN